MLFIIIFNYLFALVLYLTIQGFTIFHFFLIKNGKTTLEFCENKKENNDVIIIAL